MIRLKQRQAGSTTLLISGISVLLISMVTLMSANVNVMKTKTSANEYRTLQALLSAQAGIDFALSNLSQMDTNDISLTTLTYNEGNTTTVTGYYAVKIDDSNMSQLTITSTGQSADQSAIKVLTEKLLFSTALRADAKSFIAAPAITAGNAEIDHENITIGLASARVWSGGTITVKTPANLSGVAGTNPLALRKLGSRLFEGDSLLTTPTTTPLTILFSTQMRANSNRGIKQMSIFQDCSAAICVNPALITANSGQSKLHYIQGGSDGGTPGNTADDTSGGLNLNGASGDIGTSSNPVFLFVDLSQGGTLSLTNNPTINGIIFIQGDWDNANASATINGAIIVDGDLSNGNNLSLTFNATVFDNMSTVGVYTRMPGSWTDG